MVKRIALLMLLSGTVMASPTDGVPITVAGLQWSVSRLTPVANAIACTLRLDVTGDFSHSVIFSVAGVYGCPGQSPSTVFGAGRVADGGGYVFTFNEGVGRTWDCALQSILNGTCTIYDISGTGTTVFLNYVP